MISQELRTLQDNVDQSLAALVGLGEDKLKMINEDVKEKIAHFISMSETVDTKRVAIYNFSLQYLLFQAMLATIVFTSITSIYKFIPLMIILSQSVVALAVIFKYIRQDKCDYIFVKHESLKNYSNKWKWFYYGNSNISNIIIGASSDEDKNKSADAYLKGLTLMVNNYTADSLEEDVKDNIQQLYLLQVHNYYKNKFYMQLAAVYKHIFIAAVFGAIVGLLIA